ncbi:hypothetical protein B0T24DRAFT_626387 [Lasiosphaeria ovina]|uniref:Uncharacterized protein n=1 Tax=Lasiosphaeria ovina TaxID=92902 RepID=A0AAE0KEA5_9PEZI|nr:hypothetical protein B0T24DRAFT_626387 [Lasiosphaeria ovina]
MLARRAPPRLILFGFRVCLTPQHCNNRPCLNGHMSICLPSLHISNIRITRFSMPDIAPISHCIAAYRDKVKPY